MYKKKKEGEQDVQAVRLNCKHVLKLRQVPGEIKD